MIQDDPTEASAAATVWAIPQLRHQIIEEAEPTIWDLGALYLLDKAAFVDTLNVMMADKGVELSWLPRSQDEVRCL